MSLSNQRITPGTLIGEYRRFKYWESKLKATHVVRGHDMDIIKDGKVILTVDTPHDTNEYKNAINQLIALYEQDN